VGIGIENAADVDVDGVVDMYLVIVVSVELKNIVYVV
jgi:hypothetical protein